MISKEELLKWQTDEEFQLKMIKKNNSSIQYINNPDINIQLEAIRRDGYNIKFIHNPDINIQLEAIRQNGNSIQYIHDPSIEILNELISVNNLKDLDHLIMYVDIVKYSEIYEKYYFLKS